MVRLAAALSAAALAALAVGGGARAHGSHATVIRGSVTCQQLCASCDGAKGKLERMQGGG